MSDGYHLDLRCEGQDCCYERIGRFLGQVVACAFDNLSIIAVLKMRAVMIVRCRGIDTIIASLKHNARNRYIGLAHKLHLDLIQYRIARDAAKAVPVRMQDDLNEVRIIERSGCCGVGRIIE